MRRLTSSPLSSILAVFMAAIFLAAMLSACEAFKEITRTDKTPEQRIQDLKVLVISVNNEISANVEAGFMTKEEAQSALDKSREVQLGIAEIETYADLMSPDANTRIAAVEQKMLDLRGELAKRAQEAKARQAADKGGK